MKPDQHSDRNISRRFVARIDSRRRLECSELNGPQREAVEHTGSNLLILAGAGTGKTRTLTHRAAHLLRGTSPENIVVMTFTVKAANELFQRLVQLVPSANLGRMWVGTL
jgi:DNA helicase-2/ATP-dependent DNA helicase PcrA